MGGNVHANLAVDVPVTAPVDVGRDIHCVLAVAPNGTTFIAELETGAIIGASFDEVRKDIVCAEPHVIEEQLVAARKATYTKISEGDFSSVRWRSDV
jgi:hypothetical protein